MKKYVIVNDELVVEYILEIDKLKGQGGFGTDADQYILRASDADIWTNHTKGEILCGIIDTGNDVKFIKHELHFKNENQYHNVEYLRILLNAKNKIEGTAKMKYSMFEENVEAAI